jgi:hypothetical protein
LIVDAFGKGHLLGGGHDLEGHAQNGIFGVKRQARASGRRGGNDFRAGREIGHVQRQKRSVFQGSSVVSASAGIGDKNGGAGLGGGGLKQKRGDNEEGRQEITHSWAVWGPQVRHGYAYFAD